MVEWRYAKKANSSDCYLYLFNMGHIPVTVNTSVSGVDLITGKPVGSSMVLGRLDRMVVKFTNPTLIPGDANDDGTVDVGDLGILAANYGQSDKNWSQGDFNSDGVVDVGDLGILAANYGTGVSGAVDFNADYAQAFGETLAEDKVDNDDVGNIICSSLGLPLIAGLFLAGFMLIKLDDSKIS